MPRGNHPKEGKHTRAPKGTRDFYPEDLLRRRYITETWRAAALRHGFDEVDGPTFEHLDLYTVKSGPGIVSELFSFSREGGEDVYALRPEFTPTLARMYASRARQLPRPVRWFCIPTFFRAERPQRGRLREFLQWNCDVVGSDAPSTDADLIGVAADALASFGLDPSRVRVALSDRRLVDGLLGQALRAPDDADARAAALALLDRRAKLPDDEVARQADAIGLDLSAFDERASVLDHALREGGGTPGDDAPALAALLSILEARGLAPWVTIDSSVVRGLAYYTGTVFEVVASGRRAVAGGGRYDELVELMGGAPTPASGFAMGDVVLANLLDDHGLMPGGAALGDAVQRACASAPVRPEAFVVAGSEQEDALASALVASLRRGVERSGFGGPPWDAARYDVPPLHARTSDKATRNLKKLLADADRQHARCCVIVHGADKVQLKDLDTREDLAHETHADFSVRPEAPNYVGRAVAQRVRR